MRKLYLATILCIVISVYPVFVFAGSASVPSEYKIGPLLNKEIINRNFSTTIKVIVSLGDDYLTELPNDLIDELSVRVNALGGHLGLHAYNNVQVWVPLGKVKELSQWSEVTFISVPILPNRNGEYSASEAPASRTNIPNLPSDLRNQSVITEGLAVIGADKWQQIGITGKGINVAVLDMGFKGYNQLRGSELPMGTKAYYFGSPEGLMDSAHGTACAEIVHDVAPDASMTLLYSGDMDVDFHSAVAWMLDNDIDVTSSSIALNLKFYCLFMYYALYGEGSLPDQAAYYLKQLARKRDQMEATVAYAVKEGLTWIQAAGNDGGKKWSGWFVDDDNDKFLNFSPTEDYNILDTRGYGGKPVYILLMWEDGDNNSVSDYDMGVYDENNNLVAHSTINQTRFPLGIEACKIDTRPSAEYKIVVHKYSGISQKLNLLIGVDDFPALKYHNNTGTVKLSSPSPVSEAITVGAMEQNNGKWDIADYSSQGPGKDGILKPEIMAPAGVSTVSYGPDGFHGTSAAAPHIAGFCALHKQYYPSDSPAYQKAFLQNSAIDYGAAGPDNVYGYGMAHLPKSVFYQPTMYFPSLSSESGDRNHIGIVNPYWPLKLYGKMKAFNSSGQELANKPIFLPQGGRYESSVPEAFPNISGISYITLEYAGGKACGYMSQESSYSCCGYMVPAVDQGSKKDMFIPHIASDNIWKTQVELVNTGVLEKNVTVWFDNGVYHSFSLPPKYKKKFLIRDFFGGVPQPDIHSAKILGAQGLIGAEVFAGGNYAGGISLEPNVQKNIFFPHVANDSQWWTGLVAYNPSMGLINLHILPFDAYGTPLPGKTVSLHGESQFIGTINSLGLPTETAWFKVESTGDVHSFELFGTTDGKQMAGYSTTGIRTAQGVFPRINRSNTWTGIAFVNPNLKAVTITLTAQDDNGQLKAVNVFSLRPHEKIVDTAENLLAYNNNNFDPIRMAEATHMSFFAGSNIIGFQLEGTTDGMILESIPALAVK